MTSLSKLKSYRVGGCVRDEILGVESSDIDYVVVGESPSSMSARGYSQVGRFPVFLHPLTGEEYALARSEKSTGNGYGDFEYVWDGVSLEEDVKRRDLTINAMAIGEDGKIIDFNGGMKDLQDGILRHVSEHFVEDPLRVLRVARFAAKYNFEIAPQTMSLMTHMVGLNMLEALPAERFWKETEKALLTNKPRIFFEVLDQCGALEKLYPELHAMKGIVQRQDYHAEGDVWVHTLMVLDEATDITQGLESSRAVRIRLAAMLHDIGKPLTPIEHLYHPDGSIKGQHPGHDRPASYLEPLKALALRINIPSALVDFSGRCIMAHQDVHGIKALSGKSIINLYDNLDLRRVMKHDSFIIDDIALLCEADNYGRRYLMPDGSIKKPKSYSQSEIFKAIICEVDKLEVGQWMKTLLDRGLSVVHAKEQVKGARRSASSRIIQKHNPSSASLSP